MAEKKSDQQIVMDGDDKFRKSGLLAFVPREHTVEYRGTAYDPDVEGAFNTKEEVDEFMDARSRIRWGESEGII